MKLWKVGKIPCGAGNLLPASEIFLSETFENRNLIQESGGKFALSSFLSPDGSYGINPGDARAVYYLIRKFRPSSVLEIGTHVGTSTTHIAAALAENNTNASSLVTVDIKNVNDISIKPWLKYGVKHSPAEMLDSAGIGNIVEFVRSDSLEFLGNCKRKFDFIFLDGDHSSHVVYREIPLALRVLNKNGLILLHDYFPGLNMLWRDAKLIPGPFLAVQRLINEGANVKALPLAELPWETKLNTRITSLALLARRD